MIEKCPVIRQNHLKMTHQSNESGAPSLIMWWQPCRQTKNLKFNFIINQCLGVLHVQYHDKPHEKDPDKDHDKHPGKYHDKQHRDKHHGGTSTWKIVGVLAMVLFAVTLFKLMRTHYQHKKCRGRYGVLWLASDTCFPPLLIALRKLWQITIFNFNFQ